MGFNPLDLAGSGAVLPPPLPTRWQHHATPSSKSTMSASSPNPSAPAVAAALATDCFVVLALDARGSPFVLPSDSFNRARHLLAHSSAWHDLKALLEPAPPAPVIHQPEPAQAPTEWVDELSTDGSDESRRASLVPAFANQPARKPKPKPKQKSPRQDAPRPRKRQRSSSRNLSVREEEDDEQEDWSVNADAEPTETPTDRFPISDRNKVIANLGLRLDQMQQLACKVILKAWIKAIEPKKQSNFPYVGSDDSKSRDKTKAAKNAQAKRAKPREGPDKPDWWPREPQPWWGLLPNQKCKELERVRHKEPDHLKKEDRLVLGVHILLYQAEKEGGIELLVHSTKDCVLRFDQDNENGDERRDKRDMFLQDIYDLAQNWSDYVTGGLDADAMHVMRQYPKQALSTKKRRQNFNPKRARQESSVESQEVQQAALTVHGNELDDLSMSTRQLELQNSSSWGLSNGIPEPPPVNEYFQGDSAAFQFSQIRNLSGTGDLQHAYQQNPMMPPQVYEDVSRYAYDTKNPANFPDNPAYAMSREPSYVSQPSSYNTDWRAVQSNPSFSPASTTSLAQSSNTSYTSPSTTFPGRVDYSFGSVNQLSPSHAYQSPGGQVGGLSATSPCMPQIASTANVQPMMQGMRGQASYDEQYSNQAFRTGSLGHPHIAYNMNNQQYG
ncbi:uncharacterized protein K452DRAFT_297488 [Aplosporella prunicola CBS 121167]|uniref:Subtelomeric hrmA-associated cluster protein AFUB-079030/YDR124W-like helical bundle domain-containing protein n=1 Tax=Aplosporella prunicola CBS 121167 TaxID=1176127 RepID=A0A6A6BHQ3_9PEZI|nr:uncharacterized protein K452DRAFT_297488 [Aplosporella prunicola CBS 121167]KAF2142973.1 hypothetical protein K452DRAFT_297488 [Aplosporella prunicola CBS 121167]